MTPTQATATPDQLLPCPFCGAKPQIEAYVYGRHPDGEKKYSHAVACCGCHAQSDEFHDEQHGDAAEAEAIAAWNRRSSFPTPMSDSNDAIKADWDRVMSGLAPMSDSTVAAAGDEMAQVEQACQLSAAEWQAVAEQAERDRAGYASAFYRIAEVLGIPAQANTPEAVFEREMLPALRASLGATGVPTQPSEAQVEFALNNQMEDPTEDEEAGFRAGVGWLLAWQAQKAGKA